MLLLKGPEPSARKRSPDERRRWVLPPAPGMGAGEIEGLTLLEEVRHPVRLALFRHYRAIALLHAASAESRGELFRESSGEVETPPFAVDSGANPELDRPFRVFARAVEVPTEFDPEQLATACNGVSEWAHTSGFARAAAAFAELGALIAHDDADMAYRAGRAARRSGAFDRARQWLQLAIGRARRSQDRVTYTSTWLAWGLLELERGRPEAARACLARAWKAAKRSKLRDLAGAAQHNLMHVAAVEGRYDEAVEHGTVALKLYGLRHPSLYRLAHDVACAFAWNGYFEPALALFRAAAPLITVRGERMLLVANTGRAAAATGDRSTFLDACDDIDALEDVLHDVPSAAWANLASGALTLGYLSRARTFAARAEAAAKARGEIADLEIARTVIEDVESRRPGDVARPPPPAIMELADSFLAVLKRRADRL